MNYPVYENQFNNNYSKYNKNNNSYNNYSNSNKNNNSYNYYG